MGDLTREELRLEIDKNLGSPQSGLSGSGLTDWQDRIHRVLRQTELRIARGRSLRELNYSDSISVVPSGTPSLDAFLLDFPQNWKSIYSLRWQDGTQDRARKLTYKPPRVWDQLFGLHYAFTTGTPRFYTISKDSAGVWQLELHPTPNQSSTLYRRYSVWPAQMADDNAMSTLEYMDDLLIAWATEWLFQSRGEIEDAARWKQIRIELLGGIVMEEHERPDVSLTPSGASDVTGRQAIDPEEDPFSGLPGQGY